MSSKTSRAMPSSPYGYTYIDSANDSEKNTSYHLSFPLNVGLWRLLKPDLFGGPDEQRLMANMENRSEEEEVWKIGVGVN